MEKKRRKINEKKDEPIAKKVKKIIHNSVAEHSKDPRIKKFPENLPVSNYVAIKPKKFKAMQSNHEK
jgi:hypothetical protein